MRKACLPTVTFRRSGGSTRNVLTSLLSLLLLALTACGEPRALSPNEGELVAWYLEDLAHGLPRRPDELKLIAPSAGMKRIHTWALGSTIRGEYLPPHQLDARRTRWPALRALFSQHLVVSLADGLVAARPDLSREDESYVLPIVDEENQNRRGLDALIVSMSEMTAAEARPYLARTARARVELDREAGAETWKPGAR